MYLDVDGELIANPVDETILRQTFLTLPKEEEVFIILLESEQIFLQAVLNIDEGMLVEYHNSSQKEHLVYQGDALTTSDLLNLFSLYHRRDPRWRKAISWQVQSHEQFENMNLNPISANTAARSKNRPFLFFLGSVAALILGWFAVGQWMSGGIRWSEMVKGVFVALGFVGYLGWLCFSFTFLRPQVVRKVGVYLGVTIREHYFWSRHPFLRPVFVERGHFFQKCFVILTDVFLMLVMGFGPFTLLIGIYFFFNN